MSGFQNRLMLPWTSEPKEDRQFTIILTIMFVLLLVLSVWIPSISVPEKDREALEKLPPQLAKFVVKKKPLVKEVVKKEEPPKKEEKKAEPEKKKPPEKKETEKKKVEPKPEKKVVKKIPKVKQSVKAAREVAKKTGLLALQDELADLRKSVDVSALSTAVKPRKEKTIAAKARGLSKSNVLARSEGISTDALSLPAENVSLAAQNSEVLEESQEEAALAQAEAKAALKANERSGESIRFALEQLKESFYALYNRARRKDPFLEGVLTLECVFEPSGEVSSCAVVNSGLNHKSLESKIINRLKLHDFGAEDVVRTTREVPINFQPR